MSILRTSRRSTRALLSGVLIGAYLVAMLAGAGCGRSYLPVDVEGPDSASPQGDSSLSDQRGDAGFSDHVADADAVAEDGPACDSPCSIGQTECADGGIASCVSDATRCGVWGAPVSCGQSATCVDAPGGASCHLLDIELPRPIAPLSTATVTSHRPRFRWALAGQDDGALVQICADRACTRIVTSFSATGTSGTPAVSLDPGLYFWRVGGVQGTFTKNVFGPVWELTVPVRNATVNTSWGTTFDCNGDGFADVVVGARVIDQTISSPGAAFVYLGSAAGLSTSPTVLSNPNQFLGSWVASAGDINGDGFADLLVGVPDANESAGAVLVYEGGATGFATAATMLTAPSGKLEFGAWVQGVGDINGDGYGDVLVSAPYSTASHYIYYGGPTGLSLSSTVLTGTPGFGVTTASDINGDGFSDVLVAVGGNTNAGEVDVYFGNAAGLATTPTVLKFSGNGNGYFGVYVSDAGDTNGDGFGDVVVGLYSVGTGANGGTGTVAVYLGSATGLVAGSTFTNPGPMYTSWGDRLAAAGDINGDGFDDVVMGDPGNGANAAQISFGSPRGPTTLTPVSVPAGNTGGFGDPVSGGGDINGDGFMDVLIGSIGSPGAAYVYYGSSTGLSSMPLMLNGPLHAYQFGESLAGLVLRPSKRGS